MKGCKTTLTPLRPDWINTVDTRALEIAFSNLGSIDEVNHLIATGNIEYQIDPYIDLKARPTNKSALFSMMLHSGYLTPIDETHSKIPNREIMAYFYKKIFRIWIKNTFRSKLKLDLF